MKFIIQKKRDDLELFEVPVKDIALSELQQMKVDFKLEI
jgi:hypothetical protein